MFAVLRCTFEISSIKDGLESVKLANFLFSWFYQNVDILHLQVQFFLMIPQRCAFDVYAVYIDLQNVCYCERAFQQVVST